ncbi:hypothetical protein BDD12DRAFT_847122, partial [Trichophaea hybrida]
MRYYLFRWAFRQLAFLLSNELLLLMGKYLLPVMMVFSCADIYHTEPEARVLELGVGNGSVRCEKSKTDRVSYCLQLSIYTLTKT